MRFLVDECTGPAVAAWLRTEGHDVFSVDVTAFIVVTHTAHAIISSFVADLYNRHGKQSPDGISRAKAALILHDPARCVGLRRILDEQLAHTPPVSKYVKP